MKYNNERRDNNYIIKNLIIIITMLISIYNYNANLYL